MNPISRRTFLTTAASALTCAALPSSVSHLPSLTSRPTASLWTYLWDLVDEGWTTPLQLMRENGATHVSLAAAYHAGRVLLPHNPRRKVHFLEDGAVYFRPTPSLYGTVKPIVNSLVEQGEDFRALLKHAERASLGANAWVVCCHNTPLGMRHPDIACVNAFGDAMYHNLCPSNPDLRAYLRAIVRDLSSQGAERIELEAMQFQGYSHGFHHERDGIALTAAHRFLLGLCFCRSCFERSEGAVDLVPVQRYVRTTLESTFAEPSETASLRTLADLPQDLFAPLLAWRKTVVTDLARELMESVSGPNTALRPLVSFDPVARDMAGMDVAAVAKATGGVLMPGYVRDGTALRAPLSDVQALAGNAQVIVGLQVGMPESGGKDEFLSRIRMAKEMGVADFNFYNYGLMHQQNLGWIREGLL